MLFRLDILGLERVAGRAFELGDRLVKLGAGTEFVAAGDGESGLAFEHLIDVGLAGVELPLFRIVLLGRIIAGDRGGPEPSLVRADRLQSISYFENLFAGKA